MPADAAQQEAHRANLIAEMVSTEKSYLENLNKLAKVEQIKSILDQNPNIKEKDKKTINDAVATVKAITVVNKALHSKFEELKQANESKQDISKILKEIKDIQKVSANYHANAAAQYSECVEVIPRIQKEHSETYAAIQNLIDPKDANKNFLSTLIQPIQRYPRYVMLNTDLLKNTPAEDPSLKDCSNLLDGFKESADKVNETQRRVSDTNAYINLKETMPKFKAKNDLIVDFKLSDKNALLELSNKLGIDVQTSQDKITFKENGITLLSVNEKQDGGYSLKLNKENISYKTLERTNEILSQIKATDRVVNPQEPGKPDPDPKLTTVVKLLQNTGSLYNKGNIKSDASHKDQMSSLDKKQIKAQKKEQRKIAKQQRKAKAKEAEKDLFQLDNEMKAYLSTMKDDSADKRNEKLKDFGKRLDQIEPDLAPNRREELMLISDLNFADVVHVHKKMEKREQKQLKKQAKLDAKNESSKPSLLSRVMNTISGILKSKDKDILKDPKDTPPTSVPSKFFDGRTVGSEQNSQKPKKPPPMTAGFNNMRQDQKQQDLDQEKKQDKKSSVKIGKR